MKYTLKLAPIVGEIVPLFSVAQEMARRDATAGETPFHEPTFKGRLSGYVLMLLEQVRCGRLPVCDSFGSPIEVDPNIGATERFGYAEKYVTEPDWEKPRRENSPIGNGVLGPVYNFSHIDFGPKERDESRPNIFWHTKLKTLNEWAEKRGDSFAISYERGWVDERGYVDPPQPEAPHKTSTKAKGTRVAKRSLILQPRG